MKLPEPQTRTFSSLVAEIEKGQIKIPQFQRDFVWTLQKSAGLIDSILKGYPIGTFIFWKTKERLRSVRNLGGYSLPEPATGEAVDFVLDGQQRLTSLFACLRGITVVREGINNPDDFSQLYINLEVEENEQIVVSHLPYTYSDSSSAANRKFYISIVDLLNGDFTFLASYPSKYHEKLKLYKNRIESYQYSVIQIKDAPIEIATEIFTRINVGGKPLTLFEVMVAKTFDNERNFDLSEKFQQLIDDLKPLDYETISDATVLQVISMIIAGECKRQVILNLDKEQFIDVWDDAIDAIERTVEYFRNYYRIPVSQLLPYNGLIVPFSYFFFHHKDKPTGDKKRYLEDFFWRCSLSGRYSSSLESKLAQDIKRIEVILSGNLPIYDWAIDTSSKFIIENGEFRASRSYVKAILCIYAYHQPKSFNDNSIINISNYWLKQANSKNYHHFFPRAYLKKHKYDEFRINHVLNITIVDDFLNKREIGARPPSEYIKKFESVNPDLSKTLNSHLINDFQSFGIRENEYEKFIESRAELLSREIDKRLIKRHTDNQTQPNLRDDYEVEGTLTE